MEHRNSLHDRFKGTGQGLAIAQNVIVRKHGGNIYFETKVGEGTSFYIRIPLEEP